MDDNQTTLAAYEGNVQKYIDGTPNKVDGYIKTWIDTTLARIQPAARILEIGTATGRDADYMESRGFRVERTDATKAFVTLQQERGHEAKVLNVLTDELGGPYDLVFADAVLLHFSPDQTGRVLEKIKRSLKPGGTLAFTLKKGDGEEWSEHKLGERRYFCFWQPDAIRTLLVSKGYDVLSLEVTEDGKWLHIIAVV